MTVRARIDDKNCSSETVAERFARFSSRPDIVDLARRYDEWVHTEEAPAVKVHLALFNSLHFCERISRATYRLAVRDLATTTGFPLKDLRLLGECQLEMLRIGLVDPAPILLVCSDCAAGEGSV